MRQFINLAFLITLAAIDHTYQSLSTNRTCLDFFDAFLKEKGSFKPEAFEPVEVS